MARWENEHKTSEQVREIKRQAVLKEASRAFGRKGYHNTSLDDVARSLNIAKGTLYNYVRDKQEILFECHKEALDIGDAAMEHSSRHYRCRATSACDQVLPGADCGEPGCLRRTVGSRRLAAR